MKSASCRRAGFSEAANELPSLSVDQRPLTRLRISPASLWLMTLALLASPCHESFGQPVETSGSDIRADGTTYIMGEKGPHHRDWLKVASITNSLGQVQFQTNLAYVELSTGLHYWQSGEWKESQEAFEITPDGYAVASRGQVRAVISPVLNDANGAVELHTPDGKRMRSTILALVLYNRATGQSLRVAEVSPDAVGVLVTSNTVLYTNAFEGYGAHVRYVYEKARFHQDLILAERLDHQLLAAAGFPAADSVLEIWTAFLEADTPEITSRVVRQELSPLRRLQMEEPDIITHHLDFNAVKMPVGYAYLEGVAGGEPQPIEVSKRWIEADGNRYLVECIPLDQAEDLFARLPEAVPSGEDWLKDKPLYAGRQVPAPELARKQDQTILLADMDSSPAMGSGPLLVMDYVTITTGYWPGDYTFQGGTTYYVTGPFNVGGTLTIEGGSVIKHAESITGGIVAYGDIRFETRLYRPAILTSKNDNSIGETISGSSGNPSTYSCSALIFDVGSTLLTPVEHLRIRYAATGLEFVQGTTPLRHCQFVNVGHGVKSHTDPLTVENTLFHGVSGNVFVGSSYSTFSAAHLTVHNAGALAAPNTPLDVVNSLFVNAPDGSGSVNKAYCESPSASVFTTLQAGSHYVTDESYRYGPINFSAELLADMRKLTTYPPDIRSGETISSPATWNQNPAVAREAAAPFMLGYHYPAVDYLASQVDVQNTTLTLGPGVAVGTFGSVGFTTSTGGKLISHGTALTHNQLCSYPAVQEQLGIRPGALMSWYGYSPPSVLDARFTDFDGMAGLWALASGYSFECQLRDCELGPGLFAPESPSTVQSFTNNLFERVTLHVGTFDWLCPLYFYNNTVFHSVVQIDNDWGANGYRTIRDNLFDHSTLTVAYPNYVTYDHNAYFGGSTSLTPYHTGDFTVTALDYAEGPLGNRYIDSSTPTLVNAGSRTASAAGLSSYTIRADGLPDDLQVDIGYHYPVPKVLLSGNTAAFGLIETYNFLTGSLVNSFVPDYAGNGRGLAVYGAEFFYTERFDDSIHVCPYGTEGSGGMSDTRTLQNIWRPGVEIQGLELQNGTLHILTGYPFERLEVFRLNPDTGAVVGGPVLIGSPASSDSDGFTVLPNGNYLVNDADADRIYREYDSTTGAVVPVGLTIDLAEFGFNLGTGVATAPDGQSLYFMAYEFFDGLQFQGGNVVQTDLSGALIRLQPVGATLVEDIAILAP